MLINRLVDGLETPTIVKKKFLPVPVQNYDLQLKYSAGEQNAEPSESLKDEPMYSGAAFEQMYTRQNTAASEAPAPKQQVMVAQPMTMMQMQPV